MGVLTVTQARENLAELIDTTHRSGEPVVLTRAGRPVAVMLDHAVFERLLEAADEALDRSLRTLDETALGLA
jgi:prevent-host-death family protein